LVGMRASDCRGLSGERHGLTLVRAERMTGRSYGARGAPISNGLLLVELILLRSAHLGVRRGSRM